MTLLGSDGNEIKPEAEAYKRTLIGFRRDKDSKAVEEDDDVIVHHPRGLSQVGRHGQGMQSHPWNWIQGQE